ncbi:hypothetical protein JCM16358_15430 [Halanaerocella petrolearia]
MSCNDTKVKIKKVVDIWCEGWIEADRDKLKSVLTPNIFYDHEKLYKNGELIHQENKEYTKKEYLEHAVSLWKKRNYFKMNPHSVNIDFTQGSAIYKSDLVAELKYHEQGSLVIYDNINSTIELTLIDNQWYIVSLTNIIKIDENQ